MDSPTLQEDGPESERGELALVVITREGLRHAGTLVDTTPTAITAALPAGTHSALCIAESVQLEFAGAGPDEVIRSAARVISTRIDEGECRSRFRVSEDDAKAMSRARFRRRPLRIEVRSEVNVTLGVPGQEKDPLTGFLRDISETGLAVLVELATDRELVLRQATAGDADWCLSVRVQLAGNDRPLALVVRVRHRKLAAAKVKYGLELDLDRTLAAFPGAPPGMTEHLLRYQAALLESPRERRST